MFTAEYLLESDWYRERLVAKQHRDVALWRRHLAYVDRFIVRHGRERKFGAVDVLARHQRGSAELARVCAPEYLRELFGTLVHDTMSRAEQDQAERDARTVGAM